MVLSTKYISWLEETNEKLENLLKEKDETIARLGKQVGELRRGRKDIVKQTVKTVDDAIRNASKVIEKSGQVGGVQ